MHPTAMLSARVTAEAVRAVYPACLSGIITVEEAVEITTTPGLNGNGSHPPPAPELIADLSRAAATEGPQAPSNTRGQLEGQHQNR
jgi:hypothetical protein